VASGFRRREVANNEVILSYLDNDGDGPVAGAGAVQPGQVPQPVGAAPGVQGAGEVLVSLVAVADDGARISGQDPAGVDGRTRGKARACVAAGNTQMRACHALLSRPGTRYQDLGASWYDSERQAARRVSHHVGALGATGYEVTLCRKPQPGEPAPAA
jgi:hypothetical protein